MSDKISNKTGASSAKTASTTVPSNGKIAKTRKKHANTKTRLRTVPVIPMLNRNVYKRLNGKPGKKGNSIKCGKLTKETAIVSNLKDLEEVCGTVSVVRATRRRAMRRLMKLMLKQLMFQQDASKYPLSVQDRTEIDAIGLEYYLDDSRKIKSDSKPDNEKFSAFALDVANTVPNVSFAAVKELSLIAKMGSENVLQACASVSFPIGHQTLGEKQIHCIERLNYGPKVGQKLVTGKYDLSRCPTDANILSTLTKTTQN